MDKLKKILSEHNNFIGECNTIKIPKVYQTIFEQTYNALATVYPEYDLPSNSSAPNTFGSIIKGIFEKITSNPKSEFQEAIELWKNDPNILEIKLNNKELVLPSGGALKFNFNIGSYKKQHIILTRKPDSVTKTTIETDDNDTSNIKIYKKLIEQIIKEQEYEISKNTDFLDLVTTNTKQFKQALVSTTNDNKPPCQITNQNYLIPPLLNKRKSTSMNNLNSDTLILKEPSPSHEETMKNNTEQISDLQSICSTHETSSNQDAPSTSTNKLYLLMF